MCLNPRRLNNGIEVGCRCCWQCNARYVDDWVGRCIAESQDAVAATAVTLTYGPDEAGRVDHERAALLTYSDVQLYLKRLRRAGYPLRFVAAGEFGSEKGRAHWHLILFWQKKVPPHEQAARFNDQFWPHGFSYWEDSSPAGIRYLCKYLAKDVRATERQRCFVMSRFPPLGAKFFAKLALKYVEQGLAPQDQFYFFPDVLDQNGAPCQFYLRGASLDLYCAAYLRQWAARWGTHPPASDVIEAYQDRQANVERMVDATPFRPVASRPWLLPPGGGGFEFSPAHNAYMAIVDGQRLFWSFDGRGERAWQNVVRTETQADALKAAYDGQNLPAVYRKVSRGA